MTPMAYSAWLFQASLSACVVAGVALVIVSVRTGWIAKAIAITTAIYGVAGGFMILSPKWSEVVFEYKDFKTRIAQLETDNKALADNNEDLNKQIRIVSAIGNVINGNAKEAVSKIDETRNSVEWAAGFLPASDEAYRLAVSPNDPSFANKIAAELNTSPEAVTKAFDSSGYTILKRPTSKELENTGAAALWIGAQGK
ncbi:MAG: hypothetical protein EKK41_12200 [Hyphomicrobiales bacterium]|nr:MAG: hypothetical protein EKK41_12200 [Hyphomicrobiales bacterium]